ncbi:MAG TPA: MFS transporter [Ktedonobacterales bacterium]
MTSRDISARHDARQNPVGAQRSLAVYLMLEAMLSLFMATYGTMTAVYRVEAARLNPLQLTLVGTALEGSVFLFQLPTGALADTFSRRMSVIAGVFLTGAGFLLEGLFPLFGTILMASVLWGAGYCFISGAEEAWISDELGVVAANRLFLRASQIGMVAEIVGVGASVALASVRLNLPMLVAGGLTLALGLALIPLMPESRRQPRVAPGAASTSLRARMAEVGRTARVGVALARARPAVLLILGVTLFQGMASEGFDRLGQAHFLLDTKLPPLGPLKPLAWFGAFSIMIILLGLGATELSRRRVNTSSHQSVSRTLLWLVVALALFMAVFGLARAFAVAVVAYIAANVIRRVVGPLSTAWINQHAEDRTRATVLSLEGQSDALGQIAGGPVVGAIGLAVSLPAALLASAFALLPALALYVRSGSVGADLATADASGPHTPPEKASPVE